MPQADAIRCTECGAVLRATLGLKREFGEPELDGDGRDAVLTCGGCGRINRLADSSLSGGPRRLGPAKK